MKNKLMLRLCLMTIALLSSQSCRQDLLPEKETYHNTSAFQLTSKRISLNESKHKAKLLPELKKAEAEFKKHKPNTFGKTVNYGNGVTINTDDVIYLENGSNYHTYTFRIDRENAPADAPIENLLLTPLADGTYKEFLVTYHLTQQEKENINNGYYFYSGTGTTISELAAGTFNGNGQLAKSSCGWTSETFWVPCSSGKHDGSNFQSCEFITGTGGTPPSAFTISTYTCADVKPVTIEQTPAPIGGGGSVGEDCLDCPSTTTPQPCVQIPTDPTQPSSGMVDENGCAIGLPTLPNVIGITPKTPCLQLKTLGEKQYFKDKMDVLKANVNTGIKEKGFVLHENTNNPISPIVMGSADNDTNAIDYSPYYNSISNDLNALNSMYGNAHNHLASDTTHVGIFPPHDLNALALYGGMEAHPQSPIYSNPPKRAVTFLITDKGLFALKINDLAKLTAFVVDFAGWSNEKHDDYIKKTFQHKKQYNIRHQSTHDELVTGFLRFIKDKDIGVDLYEGNKDTYNNWKKLELIDHGNGNYNFNETPCNL
jgi:hypothetical protein